MSADTSPDNALSISMPVIVKAMPVDGRRVISVEASNEATDLEGDVVTQASLLGSSGAFLKSGHLDIDHLSEIGARYGLSNPSDFIVGKPLEVNDLGGGRTGVVAEIFPAVPGLRETQADVFWKSLTSNPNPPWRASIYGFPTQGGIIDARISKSADYPSATRYIVKNIAWKSLALTRTPVNDSISGHAQVVTMKAFAWEMQRIGSPHFAKAYENAPTPAECSPCTYMPLPRNRVELLGHWNYRIKDGDTPFAGPGSVFGSSVAGFREYFMNVCAVDYDTADIYANCLMHLLKRERRGGE